MVSKVRLMIDEDEKFQEKTLFLSHTKTAISIIKEKLSLQQLQSFKTQIFLLLLQKLHDQPTSDLDFSQLRPPFQARLVPNEPPHFPLLVPAHPSFDPLSWSPETATKQGCLDNFRQNFMELARIPPATIFFDLVRDKRCSTLCDDHVGISLDQRFGDFPIAGIALDTHALPARVVARWPLLGRSLSPKIILMSSRVQRVGSEECVEPIGTPGFVIGVPNTQDLGSLIDRKSSEAVISFEKR
ncbi:hypothetical protein L3X38_003964 [Prunus dulcis]|uniref:Uncharacterized protein n=1 Tax=Prunus dulcis TaxID=3755 RepID=A0AAD4ZN16_PRUDU|nr:hypothetical protein L3X38_003964 [Prunus dulcis]